MLFAIATKFIGGNKTAGIPAFKVKDARCSRIKGKTIEGAFIFPNLSLSKSGVPTISKIPAILIEWRWSL